jgi:hypothetical protein
MSLPRSPYDKEGGLVYFARMLDKIRLRRASQLPEAYHRPQGQGMDALCCGFLRVEYEAVAAQVGQELDDAQVLEWCYANGRRLDSLDVEIWNAFMTKRGWRDENAEMPARLKRFKQENDLVARDDIETIFEFFEVDEGRRP